MLYLVHALSQGFVAAPAAGKAVAPRVSGANMAALSQEYLIAPSILAADFANLGKEVADVLAAGADTVHFDVMDNHYVPNLTIGPMVCKALKSHGITAPIDVHLMVSPVDRIIEDFAAAGADYITFHPEATTHIECARARRSVHAPPPARLHAPSASRGAVLTRARSRASPSRAAARCS